MRQSWPGLAKTDLPDMMRQCQLPSRCLLLLCAVVAWVAPQGVVQADGDSSLTALVDHGHDPIRVRSKPVIERLPVKVIEPVDVKVAASGSLLIADRQAEAVFRLDVDGQTSLAVQDMPGIRRIQLDADDNLFVLTSGSGESAVHQITPSGQRVTLQSLSVPAAAFVRDETGRMLIAVEDTGRLLLISNEGGVAELAQLPVGITDLSLNAGGQVEVLLTSGHVYSGGFESVPELSGFAPTGSRRLVLGHRGRMLTLQSDRTGLTGLFDVAYQIDRPERFTSVAFVPPGTNAAGFDSLGNLCLVNPDLRAVTRVTSRFTIPCPHCGRPTLMIFSTEEPVETPGSRGF
jgi:hypothetical protein